MYEAIIPEDKRPLFTCIKKENENLFLTRLIMQYSSNQKTKKEHESKLISN